MNVPDIVVAREMLEDAKRRNPGPWIEHNKVAGACARKIAVECEDLDADVAYVLGLLHDIGRREGNMDMRHILCGKHFTR